MWRFQSKYGTVLHCSVKSRFDFSNSMAHLGHLINIPYLLEHLFMHEVVCYLQTHLNKPFIVLKQNTLSHRVLRVHWSASESEEFIFENGLESFQDASHGTEKVLRSSYGMTTQSILGIACAWKVHRLFLPTNSSYV